MFEITPGTGIRDEALEGRGSIATIRAGLTFASSKAPDTPNGGG
jgi:hypothetical protein